MKRIYLLGFICFPLAAAEPAALNSSNTLITMTASLFGVLLLIAGLAWLARRLNVPQALGGPLKVVATLSLGPKERLVVVQVDEQQYLLGISSNGITKLDKLEQPLPETQKPQFAELFAKFNSKQEK